MTKESSSIGSYIIPAFIGVVVAILVGLYIPQLTVIATESGADFVTNMGIAFDDTVRRLTTVVNGDFSDTAAWGVPTFGVVLGCFFRFITGEDD